MVGAEARADVQRAGVKRLLELGNLAASAEALSGPRLASSISAIVALIRVNVPSQPHPVALSRWMLRTPLSSRESILFHRMMRHVHVTIFAVYTSLSTTCFKCMYDPQGGGQPDSTRARAPASHGRTFHRDPQDCARMRGSLPPLAYQRSNPQKMGVPRPTVSSRSCCSILPGVVTFPVQNLSGSLNKRTGVSRADGAAFASLVCERLGATQEEAVSWFRALCGARGGWRGWRQEVSTRPF